MNDENDGIFFTDQLHSLLMAEGVSQETAARVRDNIVKNYFLLPKNAQIITYSPDHDVQREMLLALTNSHYSAITRESAARALSGEDYSRSASEKFSLPEDSYEIGEIMMRKVDDLRSHLYVKLLTTNDG